MGNVAGIKNSVTTRLGDIYKEGRRAVMDSFRNSPGLSAAHALSDATDEFVRAVIQQLSQDSPEAIENIVVAATGGYGRREMYPRSDVDVTFIAANTSPEVEKMLRRAFTALSDELAVAGVRFGYFYTQPDDLVGMNIENHTALLDARFVAGSPVLFAQFESSLRQALGQAAFVLHHIRARQLGKQLATPFLVEPDIKESAGGLRDLHAISWITKTSFGFSGEQVLNGLRSKGILSSADLRELDEAISFLSALRWTLHSLGGRDILGREKQINCAIALGYADTQAIMADYYRHAATARRTFDTVSYACETASLELEPGICVQSRRIGITDVDIFRRDPTAIMRVFSYAQSYVLELSPEAAALVNANAKMLNADLGNSRLILEILTGTGVARILKMMANTGVLQAISPEFDKLMRLIPYDLVHRFTVGEHTIRVIGELERQISEDDILSEVMDRIQSPECLFVAALVHDIGKIDGEGNHASRGTAPARAFAERLGMSRRQCEAVEFLVREHLVMSEFARLRDVMDDRTARDLAELVKNPEFLDMLFLLTFADYNAVGVTRLSELHRGYLLELYGRTRALLKSGAIKPDVEQHRSRMRRELAPRKLTTEEIDCHCSSLPDRYILNTSLKDMVKHITLVRALTTSKVAVDFQDNRNRQHTHLTAATIDRQGLLSDIAGILYALDVNVHSAQVFTRTDGICLDILEVDCDGRSLAETKKDQVDVELTAVIEGTITSDNLLERLGKPVPRLPKGISATVISSEDEAQAVVEVRAPDVPGLLYTLTEHFQQEGFSIRSAKVATWGHRVRDVFYITDADGNGPSADMLQKLIKSL